MAIDVTGVVTLADAAIDMRLDAPYVPSAAVLINNRGTDPIVGRLRWSDTGAAIPDDAPFERDGKYYRLNYNGGDGNDLVLRAVGQPVWAAARSQWSRSVVGGKVTFGASYVGVMLGRMRADLYEGDTLLTSAPLTPAVNNFGGDASFPGIALPAGTHTLRVVIRSVDGLLRFEGQKTFVHEVQTKQSTQIDWLTIGEGTPNQPATLKVRVVPRPIPGANLSVRPTGTVRFSLGWIALGDARIDADGVATLVYTPTAVTPDAPRLDAVYGGDAACHGSSGTTTGAFRRPRPADLYVTPRREWDPDAHVALAPYVTGDFNADGVLDGVFRDAAAGRTFIRLRNRVAEHVAHVELKAVGAANSLEAATDVDGDGHEDLVWQHRPTGRLTVWFMRDGRQVRAGVVDAPGRREGWRVVGTTDVDADGREDWYWHDAHTGELAVWHMNGLSVRQIATPRGAGPDWRVVAMYDLDRDAKTDLLWINRRTYGWSRWLMDGLRVRGVESFQVVYPPAQTDTLRDSIPIGGGVFLSPF